jgi:hypothetical protein
MVYHLRRRKDPLLECIARALPDDILHLIGLYVHCMPRHRYRLRPRVRLNTCNSNVLCQ